MPFPNPVNIPSEHTIENLSNHFLLKCLNNPKAWIFCPTPFEEKTIGYDASIQKHKIILIQYKRLEYIYATGDIKIKINPAQRVTFAAQAEGIPTDAAYYSCCVLPSYSTVSANFLAAPPQTYFNHCVFFKESDLPLGTTFISGNLAAGFDACGFGGVRLGYVPHITGPAFCANIRACRIGGRPIAQDNREHNQGHEMSLRISTVFYPLNLP